MGDGDFVMQSRLHAAVYRAPVGIAVFDLTGHIEIVNDPLYELLGTSAGETPPEVLHYFQPDDLPEVMEALRQLEAGEDERVSGEFQLVRPDGGRQWVRISCTSIPGVDGAPEAFVAHVQDIEAERAAVEALRSRTRWFSSIVERAADLILLFDDEGTVTWASPSMQAVIGVSPEEVVGQPVRRFVMKEDRGRMAEAMEELRARGTARVELRLATVDGVERWLETTASNLLDDPDVRAVITVSRDVTERHRSTQLLAHRAAHDPLTGLLNRSELQQAIATSLADESAHPVTVAYLDLDGFKAVNDELGHLVGDDVLRVVARALEGEVRADDVLARPGGDEFVVLLRAASLTTALEVAERIRRRLQEPIHVDGVPELVRISVSIGVAVARPADTATSLLHAADVALYEAKRRGRNRVEVSTAELAEAGAEVDDLLRDVARGAGEGS